MVSEVPTGMPVAGRIFFLQGGSSLDAWREENLDTLSAGDTVENLLSGSQKPPRSRYS